MREFNNDLNISQTVELMTSYSFDLHGYSAEELIGQWLDHYHGKWIRLAVIEALYLGRYKAISIEQILGVWLRLGNPNPHFSHEFERLICRKLPKHSTPMGEDLTLSLSPEAEIASLEPKKFDVAESSSLQQDAKTADQSENQEEEITPSVKEPESQEDDTQSHFSAASALRLHYQSSRSRGKSEQVPINEFTPLPDVSSFYNKLKSLAEEKLEEE